MQINEMIYVETILPTTAMMMHKWNSTEGGKGGDSGMGVELSGTEKIRFVRRVRSGGV
jgi:hypothetical protein